MKKNIWFFSVFMLAAVLLGAMLPALGAEAIDFADSAEHTDFSLELRVLFTGASDRASVFFCYSDNNNTYRLDIDELKNKTSLFLYANGAETLLWERGCELRANQSYRLRLIFCDSVFTFYIDNILLDEDTFPKLEMPLTGLMSGRIGFTSSDSVQISDVSLSNPEKKAVDFSSTYKNPVSDGADPDVLFYNGMYYLYNVTSGDNAVFKVHTSKDLVNWYYEGAVYFKDSASTVNGHMSPNVFYYDGLFYMIFAAHPKEGETQKIYYASCDSPVGVFKHVGGTPVPLHENLREIGGHPFVDDDGKVYITLCRFDKSGGYIAIQQILPSDGVITPLDNTITKVLSPSEPYETDEGRARTVEGGVLTKHNGKYYMVYASGAYDKHYGGAYAVSESIFGTYKKYAFNDFLTYNGKVDGVGNGVIVPSPDGTELFIVYHSHFAVGQVNKRQVCVDRIRYEKDPHGGDDILTVYGPTLSPQPYPSGAGTEGGEVPEIFKGLPTVYLDEAEGNDRNDGSLYRPLKSLTAAYNAIAPDGGTIILLRNATLNDISDRAYFVTPAKVTGNVYIRGSNDGNRLVFKYFSLSCNHYFDHITFLSETETPIIEARFNDLYIGKNVATFSSSKIENQYPFIVGGHYLFGDGSESSNSAKTPWVYYTAKYKTLETAGTDKNYKITVLGGVWRAVTGGNLREHGSVCVGTINGSLTLEIGGNAKVLPKENSLESRFVSALGMNSLGKNASVTLIINGGEFYCPVYAAGGAGIVSPTSTGEYSVEGKIEAYINGGVFSDFAAGAAFSEKGGVYLSREAVNTGDSVVYTNEEHKNTAAGFSSHEYIGGAGSQSDTTTAPEESSGADNTSADSFDAVFILAICLAGAAGLAALAFAAVKRKK